MLQGGTRWRAEGSTVGCRGAAPCVPSAARGRVGSQRPWGQPRGVEGEARDAKWQHAP